LIEIKGKTRARHLKNGIDIINYLHRTQKTDLSAGELSALPNWKEPKNQGLESDDECEESSIQKREKKRIRPRWQGRAALFADRKLEGQGKEERNDPAKGVKKRSTDQVARGTGKRRKDLRFMRRGF